MSDVKIDKVSYARVMKAIDTLRKNITDMRPVWKEYSKFYPTQIIAKGYKTQGGIFGAKWAKYSDSYRKWKMKHYSGMPKLVLNGDMKKASIDGIKSKITKDNLKMTIDNRLASLHQFGGKKMPARPFAMNIDGSMPNSALTWLMLQMRKHAMKGQNK